MRDIYFLKKSQLICGMSARVIMKGNRDQIFKQFHSFSKIKRLQNCKYYR